MTYFIRVMERANHFLAPVGIGAMLIMMTVVTLNVLGRAIFNAPIFGTVEVVELTGVFLASFIIGYTQLLRKNITIPILIDRMPARVRGALDSFALFVGMFIFAVLAWTGVTVAWGMAAGSEYTGVFEIAKWPFRLVWGFGCIFLFLVLAAQFVESLAKVVKK